MPTNPPSGTVTFLFTDIEGSTRLWEEHPDAMRSALARHNTLVGEAIEAAGGHVFNTAGDSFCAAFARADAALSAVAASQKALHAEQWPVGATIRVRMAANTGAVDFDLSTGDYYGPVLNRVARLLATGRGGQVLVTEVTRDLCHDQLPAGCSFVYLGEHRLADLGRPELVYQLSISGVAADFPPLRSLDNPVLKHNLPRQLTTFIGRQQELAEVTEVLARAPLVTLTGSGGCGKTRLALQAGADVLAAMADGVWLVELAALADPEFVPQAVATALGIKEEPGKQIEQTVVDHLKLKRLLLIVDNCEHLLAACATFCDALLRNCQGASILVTSRQVLGIAGEHVYRVPSLSLPEPDRAQTPLSLTRFEAVRLFVERAEQVNPGFAITTENARSLAVVCHRLDGIPLAIELAAARVRALSVDQIASRLDDRFRLLSGGSRTAPSRHQTLHHLLDWSHDLLSDAEKVLLRRLSVFAGGCTLEASEQLCCDAVAGSHRNEQSTATLLIRTSDVLDLLTSLVDQSLVVYDQRDGRDRYRLLETIRDYGRRKLAEAGEEETWSSRHRDYYLALAETAHAKRFTEESPRLMVALEQEHDNCRAALEYCARGTDPEVHLRFAGAMHKFWELRGDFREGRSYLSAALSRPDGQGPSAARGRALNGAAALAAVQGDSVTAIGLFEESAEVWRALGDKAGIATALSNLGAVQRQELQYDLAAAYFAESLELRRELDDRAGLAIVLNNMGWLAYLQSDFGRAQSLIEQSVVLSREVGNLYVLETAVGNLGEIAMLQRDYGRARVRFREALAMQVASRNEHSLVKLLEVLAEFALHIGLAHQGVRMFAAVAAMIEQKKMPLYPEGSADYERRSRLSRAALPEEAYAAEWEAGQRLTTEEAIDLAQEVVA